MSRSTVTTSPHEPEARDLLARGWSATRVHDHLVQRHGEENVPSAKALQRYRRNGSFTQTHIVPSHLIDEAMRRVQANVNIIDELDHTILVQKRRLVRMSLQEEANGETDRELRPSFKVYETCLKERFELASRIGIAQFPTPRSQTGEPVVEFQGRQISLEDAARDLEVMRNMIARDGHTHERLQRQIRKLKTRLQDTQTARPESEACPERSRMGRTDERSPANQPSPPQAAQAAAPETVRPEQRRTDERSPANQPSPPPTVPGHQHPSELSATGHFPSDPQPPQPDHGLLPAPDTLPPNLPSQPSNDPPTDAPNDQPAPPTDTSGHDEPTPEPLIELPEEDPGPYYMALEGGPAAYIERLRQKRRGFY